MKLSVTVCNVCKDPGRTTRRYTILREDGTRGEPDLCMEHGALLDELLAPEPPEPPARPAAPVKRRSARKVTTIAEIEATKRKR